MQWRELKFVNIDASSLTHHSPSSLAPNTNTASQLGVRKFGLEFAVDFQNYIIQLHHNSAAISRAISYLYEWKKRGRIFRNVTHEQFNEEFTEYLLLGLLEDMKHCLQTYGELGCVYKEQGMDGLMPVSNQLSFWDCKTVLNNDLHFTAFVLNSIPFTQTLNTFFNRSVNLRRLYFDGSSWAVP